MDKSHSKIKPKTPSTTKNKKYLSKDSQLIKIVKTNKIHNFH